MEYSPDQKPTFAADIIKPDYCKKDEIKAQTDKVSLVRNRNNGRNTRMNIKTMSIAIAALLTCGSVMAGNYATALGKCLYKNTSSEDKATLTQWAFVTLGKSSVTKTIATIPSAKTQEVDQKTQNLLVKLSTSSCSKETVQVALHEPSTGLQDAVTTLSSEMIREQVGTQAKNVLSNSLLTSGNGLQMNQGENLLKNLLKK